MALFLSFIQKIFLSIKNNDEETESRLLCWSFGCLRLKLDSLYHDELNQLERDGVMSVGRANSKEHSEGGCSYVVDTARSRVPDFV